MSSDHLLSIDAGRWPGVAAAPTGALVSARARRAEDRFAAACATAGLQLEPTDSAALVVEREELFARLAVGGWLGLAESYLAGEWHAPDLAAVLKGLISVGYRPAVLGRPRVEPGGYDGGELPVELTSFSSGDHAACTGGVFASGVATRVRTAVDSHVRGAGRGTEPARHFVDVTTRSAPVEVSREDLGAAQRRAAGLLLDAVDCRPGTRLLEYPAGAGSLATTAAGRGATVDAVTADPDFFSAVRERLTLAGTDDAVAVRLVDQAVPARLPGRFDAVVCVERFEQLAAGDRTRFLTAVDRLLAGGGRFGLQVQVATDSMTRTARRACNFLRAYVWPAFDPPALCELHRRFDRETGLRIVAEDRFGAHFDETLRLQDETFTAHHRDAAAEGVDAVQRRLWHYQFALRRALAQLGMVDLVQLTAVHRHRRGRR